MKCPKCKKESDRYNGRVCGECKKTYQREYYHRRKQDPEWLAAERKRTRERNERLGYAEKYKEQRTEEQQRKLNEYKYHYRRNNPDKRKAHGAVKRALKKGRITKGGCSVCGNPEVEAHHEDYSKPLEVVWLCRKHHAEVHRL